MTIYTIHLDDHDNAMGTDGGNAFMELTVSTPNAFMTAIRVDYENDNQPGTLRATPLTRAHSDGFNTHLELACAAIIAIGKRFDEIGADMESYSEMFEDGYLTLDL